MITYKTNASKIHLLDIKEEIYNLLSKYEMPFVEGQDREISSFIYHAIKIGKYSTGYSVKMYAIVANKERYVEINNPYLLHLIKKSIFTEIIKVE